MPGFYLGPCAEGLECLLSGNAGFRVLGVLGFRVLGFRVLGFRV